MNKQEHGKIIELTQVMYEMKGKMETANVENKEDHKLMLEHFNQLNGSVAKNTSFRNSMKGGLKLASWLIGSGTVITLIILFT